jgi:hypothetical protein
VAALVDTNVLVYRFDPRDLAKQRIARDLLPCRQVARCDPSSSGAMPTAFT